jgi:hypothetical protein
MLEYINLILICCRSTSHVSLSHYLVMKASFVWVANEQDNVILFLLGKPCLVRKTSNQLHKTKKLSTTLIIYIFSNKYEKDQILSFNFINSWTIDINIWGNTRKNQNFRMKSENFASV